MNLSELSLLVALGTTGGIALPIRADVPVPPPWYKETLPRSGSSTGTALAGCFDGKNAPRLVLHN